MTRKVFISFLGTNNYLQTCYKIDDHVSKPVRFIQEALTDFICNGWTENDKILIFYTKKAMEMNWLDNGHPREQENKELESKGLQGVLSKKPFSDIVEGVLIEEGFSEREIWNIFNTVYDKLQRNDLLYFDVTHAFRSIPMFSTVLFNFSKYMKETTLVSIRYGAFEKMGATFEIKNIPVHDRIAPVLDLTNVVRLQLYTDMANALTTFGRIKGISQVLINEHSSLSPIVSQLSNAIELLDNYILANRMTDIKKGKYIIMIRNSIKAVRKIDGIPSPIKNVIETLNEELREFVAQDSFQNIEAAINWAVKYKMLPQAYTLGQEYIISLLAERFAELNPYNKMDRKSYRQFLSAVCSIGDEDVAARNYKGFLSGHDGLVDKLLDDTLIKEVRAHFAKLGHNRNTINHAKGNTTYEDLLIGFNEFFYPCIKQIQLC